MSFEDDMLKGMQQKNNEETTSIEQENITQMCTNNTMMDFGNGEPILYNLTADMFNFGNGIPVTESVHEDEKNDVKKNDN